MGLRSRSRKTLCIASSPRCRVREKIINGMHPRPPGVDDFLRAYYHHKSADWKDNKPYPIQSWSAHELAKLPTYYVMDLAKNMAETVAEEMPSAGPHAADPWLPDRELAFY